MQLIKDTMLYDPLNTNVKPDKEVIAGSISEVQKYLQKVSGKEIDPLKFNLKMYGVTCGSKDLISLYPSKCLSQNMLKLCIEVLSREEDTRIDILGGYSMFDLDFYDKFFKEIISSNDSEEEKFDRFNNIFKLVKIQGNYRKYIIFWCRSTTGNFLVLFNNFLNSENDKTTEMDIEEDENTKEFFDIPSILVFDHQEVISEETHLILLKLSQMVGRAINLREGSARCKTNLPVYQMMVPKIRDPVESDVLLLTTLSCLLQKPDHLLSHKPNDIDVLDWWGYSIMRNIREFFIKYFVQEYRKKSLSISKEVDEILVGPELQNAILSEEIFYEKFDEEGFEQFLEKSGVKSLGVTGNDLEKIKIEFYY